MVGKYGLFFLKMHYFWNYITDLEDDLVLEDQTLTPKDDSPSPLIIIETTPENNSSEVVTKETSKDELIEILKAML